MPPLRKLTIQGTLEWTTASNTSMQFPVILARAIANSRVTEMTMRKDDGKVERRKNK